MNSIPPVTQHAFKPPARRQRGPYIDFTISESLNAASTSNVAPTGIDLTSTTIWRSLKVAPTNMDLKSVPCE